jgi:asparagine synthase (glutamine-hydrolysing)
MNTSFVARQAHEALQGTANSLMCGIAAIVESPAHDFRPRIDEMTDSLVHRGPDDRGTEVLASDGVALGMRRLSIVDLDGGHQPMWDERRRHCVVFNGEIYNAADIRKQLLARGHEFATDHSDTEVLVHGFEEWGPTLFERLNGMFSLAIWDRDTRRLVIARDRTGKKPLYVARIAKGYAIASELKALLCHPDVSREVDPCALEQYLAFDYVIAPRTMLRNVQKLPAAHYASVTATSYEPTRYWSPEFDPRPRPEEELLEEFDSLLDESVRRRMVADVPIGLFLSGGLDSTTIGYYMRRQGADVRSFSIGFDDARFDESPFARIASAALGTQHQVEVFSQSRVRDLVPRIAEILDEPMGDQSILPTYLLSTFTRSSVKVAVGGDGSDELLMGYKAYRPLKVSWAFDGLPRTFRHAVAGTARCLPTRLGPHALRGVEFARRLDGDPAHRLLSHLGSFNGHARWILASQVRAELPSSVFDEPSRVLLDGSNGIGPAEQTVLAYLRGYLQDDILVKVDRASMAASLEVRAPFLDPSLVDFLLKIPASLKLRGLGSGKYLLRRLMRGRIPDEIIDRPKVGFGVPLNRWLRESLAPLVIDQLDPVRLGDSGYFDPAAVRNLVAEHLAGRRDNGHKLWLLVQFELWRSRWLD